MRILDFGGIRNSVFPLSFRVHRLKSAKDTAWTFWKN